MTPSIDWHYPRPELTEQYLTTLRIGLVHSLCCFAPRRKGKTEWLDLDIRPAAKAAGFRYLYVSMWENRANPAAALVKALLAGAAPRNLVERARSTFGRDLSKAGLEFDLKGSVKATAELRAPPTAGPDAIADLPAALEAAVRMAGTGKLLLVVDEVQHLAKPEFHDFVATLRTLLDTHKTKVCSIFTGSSRVRLQQMFEQTSAPLFQFSSRVDFPDLDRRFVDFMLQRFEQATRRTLDGDQAMRAFLETGSTPGVFRDGLNDVLIAGGTDILTATRTRIAMANQGAAYEMRLMELLPFDQVVLATVLQPGIKVFGEPARSDMGARLGLTSPVTTTQVQQSINRMMAAQILFRTERGTYQIEDDQMATWYQRRIEGDVDDGDADGATPLLPR